jgi:Polyketide cyclase / dehydrase and lipid transport
VPAPNGVGAIRRVGVVGPAQTEEITLYQAPTKFAYELRSGLPVKDHRATVTLSEVPAGTQITYHVRAKSSIPGGDVVLGPIMKFGIRAVLRGLIRAAERSAKISAHSVSADAG